MAYRKLAALFAATVIGAALIAAPALARGGGGGGGGGHGGGGHGGGGGLGGGGGHGGGGGRGGGMHAGGGVHVGGVSRSFSGRIGGAPIGVGRMHVVANHAFFPRHHFPRHRVFVRSFGGYGLYAGYSCWRWVPTPYGLTRVWACDYPYGPY
jgi:hypothetical protein